MGVEEQVESFFEIFSKDLMLDSLHHLASFEVVAGDCSLDDLERHASKANKILQFLVLCEQVTSFISK